MTSSSVFKIKKEFFWWETSIQKIVLYIMKINSVLDDLTDVWVGKEPLVSTSLEPVCLPQPDRDCASQKNV